MFEGAFSPMHWLVVLFIVLLLFGPSKLPEIGKGLGTAIRGFKDALAEGESSAQASARQPSGSGEPSRPEGPSATA